VAGAKDAVVNKVKEIASGALDAVKKFFGIKSPSRVMAQMGDFMMQGMQNGIERAGQAVVSAATTISGKISDGMSRQLAKRVTGRKKRRWRVSWHVWHIERNGHGISWCAFWKHFSNERCS
jgi:phage-related protein